MPTPEEREAAEEAEIDRLVAALGKSRELPEDLIELMWAIATRSFIRMVEPGAAPFQLGRFEALDTKFGRMSMVIEARDPQHNRKVAIKFSINAGLVFAAVKTGAVHEAGMWNDRLYVVMGWVESARTALSDSKVRE